MDRKRRTMIAGNWKMNGLRGDGIALIRAIVAEAGSIDSDLVVCPSFVALSAVGEALRASPVHLGAQDCHPKISGPHTGDVAAEMLADVGCRFVIVGHSERRTDHQESDAVVEAKAAAAHRAGLTAIICIGETEAERDAGKTASVVRAQVANSVPRSAIAEDTVIAYEPVWAIGTGRTPEPDEVEAVHSEIRDALAARIGRAAADAVRILYGGSVKAENARSFIGLPNVDGALVGGASLDAASFLAIARAAP